MEFPTHQNEERPSVSEAKEAISTLVIAVNKVEPDPNQPRKHFDPVKLQELADSIVADGQLQPIGVRPHPELAKRAAGIYMIVFGERRWRAHQLAGLPTIRVEVGAVLSPQEIRIRQYRENADRDNLNPVEEAEFLDAMLQEVAAMGVDAPQEALAETLGMPASTLSRKLSVLRYSATVRQLVRDGIVTQVNALAKLNKLSPAEQSELSNHTRQLAGGGGKFDVSAFLKDPQKYFKALRGEAATEDAASAKAAKPAKTPAPFKTTWRLGRSELVRLADVMGLPDLVERLQDAPDEELPALADELRNAMLPPLVAEEA